MSDNPQDAFAAGSQCLWFALPDHRIVELEGRDATAFAQAQFMNDVAALGEDRWQWNGWLTAKGRVVALFALLRIDPTRLWLLLPDTPPEALVEGLRRFVFRSKLQLRVREDLHVAGSAAPSRLASGNHWAGDPETAIEIDYGGTPLPADAAGGASRRRLRIGHGPEHTGHRHDAQTDPDALMWWKAADLLHGWPRLEASQREQWTPQQLSLERLQAYSVKKGCYPGQEIVARTHFLGQAKRGLALLRTKGVLSPGTDLPGASGSAGTVIAVAGDIALAVAPAGADTHGTTADAADWWTEPLREGLAR